MADLAIVHNQGPWELQLHGSFFFPGWLGVCFNGVNVSGHDVMPPAVGGDESPPGFVAVQRRS